MLRMNTTYLNRSQSDSMSHASFFNQVYAWMSAGLAVTGVIAWLTANSHQLMATMEKPAILISIIITQFLLVMIIAAATESIGAAGATLLFLFYAALNGLVLSVVFVAYAKATVASAFFVSAGTFAICSIYGAITKKDLTEIGSLCIMSLLGLIIAMIVNIFIANSMMDWIINIVGVLVFVGLTAYDTQKLKVMADEGDRMAIVGSLTLYLDFINLFLFILRLMGGKGKN